jgi:catechol 2,3-dioxygenase-like lactoylglutathione lyase family enzyme
MRAGRLRFPLIAQEEIPMKRFHVHVGVEDLDRSIAFYSGLFGAEPTMRKSDYAKWMIDEPRVNFAISQRGAAHIGVNHLGLQADSSDELAGIRDRFEAADSVSVVDEPGVHCCYAKGDKHWVTDPQGIAWEAFHTLESIPFFSAVAETGTQADACCSPATASLPSPKTDAPSKRSCCS